MLDNPIDQFIEWYKDAKKCASIKHPEAMTLSTINNGCPDSRVVLLKTIDNTGFIFFTNYESSKGKDLEKNPNACMLFYWEKLKRQVRIRGTVERTQSTLIAPLLNTFLKTTASIKKKSIFQIVILVKGKERVKLVHGPQIRVKKLKGKMN